MEIHQFLRRCDAYCAKRRISRARLSTLLFNSGVTLGRLEEGGGVTVRVLGRACDRLAEMEHSLGEKAVA